MAVSKRLRAEIFRRDNHTCQSCGAKAPDVAIVPDHVVPVALGGSDHPSNLQTLCEPCNSGKSATPPDAAVVAKVAEDAVRWARAIEAAAENVVGEHKEARAAFDQKWRAWGEGRPPIPRPEDWGLSVDKFLKVGLPLPILLDCIDIAMRARHVKASEVFTYMCGAAWKEVKKLQQAAQAILSSGSVLPVQPVQEFEHEELLQELFDLFTADEVEVNGIDSEAVLSLERNEDDQYPIVAAVDAALCDLRSDLSWMSATVSMLLEELPGGVGEHAMKIARFRIYERLDLSNITRERFTRWAMDEAIDLLQVLDAERRLSALSVEERAEWIEYARGLNGSQPRDAWHRDLSPEVAIVHAAAYAEMLGSSGSRHKSMCGSRGEHIAICPRPAKYWAYIAEFDCCAADLEADHEGHKLCEQHLELMVDGKHTNSKGVALTLRDFKELEVEEPSPPPF